MDIHATSAQERFPVQQAIFEGKLNSLCVLLDNRVPAEVLLPEGYSLLQYAIARVYRNCQILYSRRFAPITLDGKRFTRPSTCRDFAKTETVLYLSIGISPYEQMITPVLEHVLPLVWRIQFHSSWVFCHFL